MALRIKKWRNPNNMDEVRVYVNGFDGDQSSPYFRKAGTKAILEIPREVKNPERMKREIDSYLYDEHYLQLEDLDWAQITKVAGW